MNADGLDNLYAYSQSSDRQFANVSTILRKEGTRPADRYQGHAASLKYNLTGIYYNKFLDRSGKWYAPEEQEIL